MSILFNARENGAYPDGRDSYPAIEKSLRDHVAVGIPPGKYHLSQPLKPIHNRHLEGVGNSTELIATHSEPVIQVGWKGQPIHDVSIEKLTLSHAEDQPLDMGSYGLAAYSFGFLSMHRVRMRRNYIGLLLHNVNAWPPSTSATITNCHIDFAKQCYVQMGNAGGINFTNFEVGSAGELNQTEFSPSQCFLIHGSAQDLKLGQCQLIPRADDALTKCTIFQFNDHAKPDEPLGVWLFSEVNAEHCASLIRTTGTTRYINGMRASTCRFAANQTMIDAGNTMFVECMFQNCGFGNIDTNFPGMKWCTFDNCFFGHNASFGTGGMGIDDLTVGLSRFTGGVDFYGPYRDGLIVNANKFIPNSVRFHAQDDRRRVNGNENYPDENILPRQ